MKTLDSENLQNEFSQFYTRFSDVFRRSEPREQSRKYVRGLLSASERKTSWQVAEFNGDPIPDATQRLLYRSEWNEELAMRRLQEYTITNFGDPGAILVFDETGFIKKGDKSAGVQRQYSGTAGKIENCQIGVFMSYVSRKGHVLFDRRLYLPESWCADRERCRKARIPDEVKYQTKQELALQMLHEAMEARTPFKWVTGDEVYGSAHLIRDAVENAGKYYVLAIASHLTVWKEWPDVTGPINRYSVKGGRPRTKLRLKSRQPRATAVKDIVAGLSPQRWQRFSVARGEKGERIYEWSRMRVVESKEGLPLRNSWLLIRRSVETGELAYYLSNAPKEISLSELAGVAAQRFAIEQCFEEAKGETGLDHYEVRYWHSWYRHVTLSMMAQVFLAVLRSRYGGKKTFDLAWLK